MPATVQPAESAMKYRRIVLASRPRGRPVAENFRLEEAELPEPGPGEVAVRTLWLSLDPYMRGRMDDAKSYARPVGIGETMEGGAVGEVIASNAADFAPGDIVVGRIGWADHGVLAASELRKVDPGLAPVQTALGILGMPGHTAWVGVNDILRVGAGDTVVISAATGAVGSLAGQLARLRGAKRVIGIAGGAEKCAFARAELGYDVCLDHRAAADGRAMAAMLAEAAPDGITAYFENVGGKVLEGVLPNMADHGRIAVCGMIAWYSGQGVAEAAPAPFIWRTILVKRLTVRGFIIFDHPDRFAPFIAEVAPLIAQGRIRYREDITEGLENAPEAFMAMLEGGNFGKTLVKVG
ncbi:MAG: NADP-dependent oxidoreductase [Alphaproteobacteria bacterium]|nr:MAG: NADP-dependent oxidoreductase [Alphaproteobacteria bacterium]